MSLTHTRKSDTPRERSVVSSVEATETRVARWVRLSRDTLRSPLVRRVSVLIFVSIVVIEAVLLWFSYFTERDRLLTRMDDAFYVMAPLLQSSNTVAQLDTLLKQPKKPSDQYASVLQVVGYSYTHADKAVTNKGISFDLQNLDVDSDSRLRFHKAAQFYDTGLVFADNSRLSVRLSAEEVTESLNGYVTRIIMMVVLISAFVTVTCIVALRSNFLFPIINLQGLMRNARTQGLDQVQITEAEHGRTDEIGSVYRGFERLRQGLIQSQDENAAMGHRFQRFAELGADCFWETDSEHRFCYLAGDIEGLTGFSESQLLGKTMSELADTGIDCTVFLAELHENGEWEGEINSKDVELRYLRVRAQPIFNQRGKFTGALGTLVDATESATLSRHLAHQASHDELTGLINRRAFDQKLQEAFASYENVQNDQCVLMLDLDKFKRVNDNCGHAAGDILLQQVAELIRFCVRDSDTVARFGGDEFSLVLYDCGVEKAMEVAEKLRLAIDDYTFHWGGSVYALGASIGVAKMSAAMQGPHDALSAADASCFKAKNQGRNQVVLFDPEDQEHLQQRGEMQWINIITEALDKDRFELHYQWNAGLGGDAGSLRHIEIKPRLQDSAGTLYPPDAYLPAAERFSLVSQINRAVVSKSLQWLAAQNLNKEEGVTVSISLAESALDDPVFHEFLIDSIKTLNINPAQLCFEFPELSIVQYSPTQGGLFDVLRSLGCKLGIDDFGCGFASLAVVQNLPIDYLKINGKFVGNVCNSPVDQALMRSVTEVAGFLNLRTIATQVNDKETALWLQKFGVDLAQGGYFSDVLPLGDFDASMQQYRKDCVEQIDLAARQQQANASKNNKAA